MVTNHPERIMMKRPFTLSSLNEDLEKIFTDELESFGQEFFDPPKSGEDQILTNDGQAAVVPKDAQKLFFLTMQYVRRGEVLLEEIKDSISKSFGNDTRWRIEDEILSSKIHDFVANDTKIPKLRAWQKRVEILSGLAWGIVHEHIGHDPTHQECQSGIGIRRDWKIVKRIRDDSSSAEFGIMFGIMKDSNPEGFEGLDDIIE